MGPDYSIQIRLSMTQTEHAHLASVLFQTHALLFYFSSPSHRLQAFSSPLMSVFGFSLFRHSSVKKIPQ